MPGQRDAVMTPRVGSPADNVATLSPRHYTALLLNDQRQRWRRGERPWVESYVEKGELRVGVQVNVALDLIHNEILLRRDLSEAPALGDYIARFPQFAAQLRPMFDPAENVDLDRPPSNEEPSTLSPASNGRDSLSWEAVEIVEPEAGGQQDAARPFDPGSGGNLPAAASGAQPERELQSLLRSRLLLFVVVCVAFFAVLPMASVPQLLLAPVPASALAVLGLQWGMATLILMLGLVVWARPGLRLRTLRIIELAIFAAATLVVAVGGAYLANKYALLELPDGRVGHPVLTPSGTRLDPVCIRWLVLVVAYGTLIPNTWRRGSLVVGSMAISCLAILAVQGSLAVGSGGSLIAMMLYPTMWMIAASMIAVFGCHRVSVLHKEVLAARRLGQYQLRERLGSGGMGDVYLAEHVLLKQPCAVKVIRPERAGDPVALRRFEREVQAMARLDHPNTVEIHDYGHTADGTFYYVMEHLPGLNLEDLVVRFGPQPAARVVHVLRQICGALREAHGMGLIHRDIKPANIILSQRGGVHDVAKLLDFGLVKNLAAASADTKLTHEENVAGTPAYMAPEQAQGHGDARSDIYSLGAVAYYLLAGRSPFAGRSALETLVAQVHEAPPPLLELRPQLPSDLAAIVQRCLEKKPSDRFADAAALEKALSECAGLEPWSQDDAVTWWRFCVEGGPLTPA
jgi:serine/threonine-protein kinase